MKVNANTGRIPLKPPVRLAVLLLLFATGALLLSLAQSQPAHAQVTDFDYNFETHNSVSLVNDQLLFGQDQWVNEQYGNVFVRNGLGVNQTQTAKGGGGCCGTGAIRPLDNAFYYTTEDTNVGWGVWGYVPSVGNVDALGGIVLGGIVTVDFGPHHVAPGSLTTYLRRQGAPSTDLSGDVLLYDHWYEFSVIVDFSIYGGSATLSYRDVAGGATVFTTDSAIQNVNLGLVPDSLGRYGFSDVLIRNDGAGYVDNLHFDAPAPTPTATSSTGEYCISGVSTGVGWDWKVEYVTTSGSIIPLMGTVPAAPAPGSVPSPFLANEIADTWSQNINGSNVPGLSASHVASSNCFKVLLDTTVTGAISPFAYFVSVRTSGGAWCLVTNNVCSFNPTVYYVAPVGGTVALSVTEGGSPFPSLPLAASSASAVAVLATAIWYVRRRWLN